jgi:hypothetical protein
VAAGSGVSDVATSSSCVPSAIDRVSSEDVNMGLGLWEMILLVVVAVFLVRGPLGELIGKVPGKAWVIAGGAIVLGLLSITGVRTEHPTATVVHSADGAIASPPALTSRVVVSRHADPRDVESSAREPLSAITALADPLPQGDTSTTVARPSWVVPGQHLDGDQLVAVISSKQYATLEEARADADEQVRQLLQDDLARVFSSRLVGSSRLTHLSVELVRQAVRDEFVETVERDFGTFRAPMHRLWYRVEVSPDVRTSWLQSTHAHRQEERLWLSIIAALAVLCVPATVLVHGRVSRWTGERGRPILLLSSVGVLVLVWAAAVYGLRVVQSQGPMW